MLAADPVLFPIVMLFIELSIAEFPVNATPVMSFPSVMSVFIPSSDFIVPSSRKYPVLPFPSVKLAESSTSISISPFLAYTAILFSPVVIEARVSIIFWFSR